MKHRLDFIFSIILPGLGQMLLGRVARGAMLLITFGVCVDVGLFAQFYLHALPAARRALTLGPYALAALVWLYGIVDAVRLTLPDVEDVRRRRDEHFRRGLLHFLKDELGEAEAEFGRAIQLDPDDVDARYHLALTLKAADDPKRARRAFRRCREADEHNKWARETEQRLREL